MADAAADDDDVEVLVEVVVAQGTCHFGSNYSGMMHSTRETISDWQLETSLRCCSLHCIHPTVPVSLIRNLPFGSALQVPS